MPSFTEHLGFHASALQLRSRRNEMLASNIANAATPNFKARDLDFDTELKRINKIGNIQTTNNSHFASIQKRIGKDSVFRLPIHPSLDGNTVEMAVEQMQFSENLILKISTLAEKIPNLVPVSVSSLIRACSLLLKTSRGVSEYFSMIASLILIVSGASLRLFFLLISSDLSFSIIFLFIIDFGILLANFDPENKF